MNNNLQQKTSSTHHTSCCPSIQSNIEALTQGAELLEALSEHSYTHKALPYVQSSIGEHFRHIFDLYLALINQQSIGLVDYDNRRRGAPLETDLAVAKAELQQIAEWLNKFDQQLLDKPIKVQSEASISSQQVCEITSTFRRELLFVSSHTIHHFALIKVITVCCDIETSEQLGYAPATATYLRGRA